MYIPTYTCNKKLLPTLWVSKFDVKLGGGGTQFLKLPNVPDFSNIWFQKSFFFLYFFAFIIFFENLKNVFSNAKLKKVLL